LEREALRKRAMVEARAAAGLPGLGRQLAGQRFDLGDLQRSEAA
jgi:hypothetical protein